MQFLYNFSEEIPEEFYMSDNNQPPTECSVCGNEFGEQYFFIEKSFQKTHDKTEFQLSFEYAVCERCKRDMLKSISKKSIENIKKFALSIGEISVAKEAEELKIDLDYLLKHCLVTGKPIHELNEYHLIGMFKNGKMVQLPMLYGEKFLEEYSEILSEETKGFFDDFFNHITILPPAFAKILEEEKPKRPVLI